MKKLLVFGLFYAVAFKSAKANSQLERLPIKVIGLFKERPSWKDASGAEIQGVDFRFEGSVGLISRTDVISKSVAVNLTGAETYPAEIAVKLPKNCSIADFRIRNEHVVLLLDGQRISNAFKIFIDRNALMQLAFIADAQVGATSGVVSCKIKGTLRYSY